MEKIIVCNKCEKRHEREFERNEHSDKIANILGVIFMIALILFGVAVASVGIYQQGEQNALQSQSIKK